MGTDNYNVLGNKSTGTMFPKVYLLKETMQISLIPYIIAHVILQFIIFLPVFV